MQLAGPHIHVAKRQLILALRHKHPSKPTRHHPHTARIPTKVDNDSLCIGMRKNRFTDLGHERCQEPDVEANNKDVPFDHSGLQCRWNIGEIAKRCGLTRGLNTGDI